MEIRFSFFCPLFSILFSSRLLFSLSFISLFLFLSLSFVFYFIVSFPGVSGAAGRCPRMDAAGQSPALRSAASPRQTGRVLRGVWQLKAARSRSEYRLRGVRGSAASTDPNGTAGIIEAAIQGSKLRDGLKLDEIKVLYRIFMHLIPCCSCSGTSPIVFLSLLFIFPPFFSLVSMGFLCISRKIGRALQRPLTQF